MKRRVLFTTIGGAAALWPLAARAQPTAMPVVGFLNAATVRTRGQQLAAFQQGLGESGYVEGRNVAVEYRWAEGHVERLPAMASELVQRKVAVIAATTEQAAVAAKAATQTIPIVFETAADPVEIGLVPSLNRPAGNLTGVTQLGLATEPKSLELLRELFPSARALALLIDPAYASTTSQEKRMLEAARALGMELHVLRASSERDFEEVFAKVAQLRAAGLVISAASLFTSHSDQLAQLSAKYAVPTVYHTREFVAAGGLASYGSDATESYRLAGTYVGRILKGAKPADLPVLQATKLELFINLKTAKALGIVVPLSLSGRADEVIE
jgi:putative tryptophan/tyrosine transport system substrate-binding protein